MAIINIKNKWLRRFLLLVLIVPLTVLGILIHCSVMAWEVLCEVPSAVYNCWKGRESHAYNRDVGSTGPDEDEVG